MRRRFCLRDKVLIPLSKGRQGQSCFGGFAQVPLHYDLRIVYQVRCRG